MPQESIIDSIKKNVIFRKKFKNRNKCPFTFKTILSICEKIFNKKISKDMYLTYFNYEYLNRNGKKETIKYKVEEFDEKDGIIKISRKGFDGLYKTTFNLSKNNMSIYYFESVSLKEAPFQIWGQVGRLSFGYHFRKRKKIIKKELYKNE